MTRLELKKKTKDEIIDFFLAREASSNVREDALKESNEHSAGMLLKAIHRKIAEDKRFPEYVKLYAGIDEKDKNILRLIYQGRKQTEIADIVHLSIETIKDRCEKYRKLTGLTDIKKYKLKAVAEKFFNHKIIKVY